MLALNGLTVVHYLVGGAAILAAYRDYPIVGWPLGMAYLVFAMVQLYVLMPQVVCPGCVYRTIRDGRCPSGLNLISARLAPPAASAVEFGQRTHGALCQSSLCLWSWLLPVPLALPGLALSFSWTAATLTAVVAVLAVARMTVVARVAVCSALSGATLVCGRVGTSGSAGATGRLAPAPVAPNRLRTPR